MNLLAQLISTRWSTVQNESGLHCRPARDEGETEMGRKFLEERTCCPGYDANFQVGVIVLAFNGGQLMAASLINIRPQYKVMEVILHCSCIDGAGAGKTLFEAIKTNATLMGCSNLCLSSSPGAVKFWRAQGLEEFGTFTPAAQVDTSSQTVIDPNIRYRKFVSGLYRKPNHEPVARKPAVPAGHFLVKKHGTVYRLCDWATGSDIWKIKQSDLVAGEFFYHYKAFTGAQNAYKYVVLDHWLQIWHTMASPKNCCAFGKALQADPNHTSIFSGEDLDIISYGKYTVLFLKLQSPHFIT